MSDELKLEEREGELLLDVRVVPRASRSRVTGVHDGALKIALEAPPVDGAANEALIAFLADALGCRRRDVALVRGARSRRKRVSLRGVPSAKVRALLG